MPDRGADAKPPHSINPVGPVPPLSSLLHCAALQLCGSTTRSEGLIPHVRSECGRLTQRSIWFAMMLSSPVHGTAFHSNGARMSPIKTFRVFGERVDVLIDTATSNGASATVVQHVPPGGGPPPHSHKNEEETFTVLEGDFEILSPRDLRQARHHLPHVTCAATTAEVAAISKTGDNRDSTYPTAMSSSAVRKPTS